MAQYGTTRVIDTGGFNNIGRLIATGAVVLLLIITFACSVTRVDTGNVAVLTQFGRVTGEVLPEGIHLINPLKAANELTVRTLEQKETATVPSSEGLIITLDASLLFHLDAAHAADVYQKLGRDYQIKVVEPTMRSALREATASHQANAL